MVTEVVPAQVRVQRYAHNSLLLLYFPPEFPQLTYLRQQWDLDILPFALRANSKKKRRGKKEKAKGREEKPLEGCVAGGVVTLEEEEEGDQVDPSTLEPTRWKEQDHYALLGLGRTRYRASPQQIRKACE